MRSYVNKTVCSAFKAGFWIRVGIGRIRIRFLKNKLILHYKKTGTEARFQIRMIKLQVNISMQKKEEKKHSIDTLFIMILDPDACVKNIIGSV